MQCYATICEMIIHLALLNFMFGLFQETSSTTTVVANSTTSLTLNTTTTITTTLTTPNASTTTPPINGSVNTGAPVIHNLPATVTVPENSPASTVLLTLNATDPDGAPVSFRLIASPSDGNFALKPAAGEVVVVNDNANIDYESHYIYHLTITATDGELNSVSKTLTVNVNNTNEPPQVTNPGSILVTEGTKGDQILYQVTAKDEENDPITYQYSVSPTDGSSYFSVDINGRVKLSKNAVLNYENRTSYTMSIKACDATSCGASANLVIQIGNVNEGPKFSPTSLSLTIDENQVTGYILPLSFKVTDPDNDVITYGKLATSYSTNFKVNSATGAVSYGPVFDFDDPNLPQQITFYLTATDPKGRQDRLPVTITLVNLNDNAPQFLQTLYTPSVGENTIAGINVVAVSAKDNDLGSFGTLTYSMDTNGVGGTYFSITNDGQIKVKAPADREVYRQINFTVYATDTGGKRASAQVQVTLLDRNDNRPIFNPDFYNTEVRYNTTSGKQLTSVTATDTDATGNAVTYVITSGDTSYFSVGSVDGKITVTKTPLELHKTYRIGVKATDNGNPKLSSSEATVRIDTYNADNVVTFWEMESFIHTFTESKINTFREKLKTLCNLCIPRIEETKAASTVGRTVMSVYFLKDKTTESRSNLNSPKAYIPAETILNAYTIDSHGNPDTVVKSSTFVDYPIVRIHRNRTTAETNTTETDWLETPGGQATLIILLLLAIVGIAVVASLLVNHYCPPSPSFFQAAYARKINPFRNPPSLLNRNHARADTLNNWDSRWNAKYGKRPHAEINGNQYKKPIDGWRAGNQARAPTQKPPEVRSQSAASSRHVDVKLPREIRPPDAGKAKWNKLATIPPPKSIK